MLQWIEDRTRLWRCTVQLARFDSLDFAPPAPVPCQGPHAELRPRRGDRRRSHACMHVRTVRIRPSLVLYGHPLLGSPLTHEWPAFEFSSSKDSSSLCRPRQCVDDLVAGGTGIASLLVEMLPEAACCAPAGNARAAARVAKAAEVTTRTKSMAAITFLTVDVEEVVDDIIINYSSC